MGLFTSLSEVIASSPASFRGLIFSIGTVDGSGEVSVYLIDRSRIDVSGDWIEVAYSQAVL